MSKREPRILLYDIETLPNVGTFWDRYPRGGIIPWENIAKERTIACVAWTWLGSGRVRAVSTSNGRDNKICEKMAALWKSADAIVAHNGDKYDFRWIKGRMFLNNLPPPAPVVTTDTMKVSKKHFNLNSYSLDYVAQAAGIKFRKIETRYELWLRCMSPDSKVRASALREMVRYCKQDVRVLEKLYEKLRPFDQDRKLNRALFSNDPERTCPNCQKRTLLDWGYYPTRAGLQKRLYCPACCSWSKRPMGSVVPR